MGRDALSRLRWYAGYLHRRFGWPLWWVFLSLLASLWLGTQALVARQEALVLLAEQQEGRTHSPPQPIPDESAEDLSRFYATLPEEDERFFLLKQLLLAAEDNGVLPPSADYKLTAEPLTRLVRYQINLPVKGEWGKIQSFLTQTLGKMRNLVVDSISLQREGSDAALVEGRIQFSVLMMRSATRTVNGSVSGEGSSEAPR